MSENILTGVNDDDEHPQKSGPRSNPWDRQPGESSKAYFAFTELLRMGGYKPVRGVTGLKALARSLGHKLPVTVQTWSSRYRWRERARAYEDHVARIAAAKADLVIADAAIDWAKRQRSIREREFSCAEKALGLIESWLQKVIAAGGVSKMRIHDAAKLLEIASRVGRLASGMPTNRDEITGADGGAIRVEIEAAIAKVYGAPAIDVEEAKALEQVKASET